MKPRRKPKCPCVWRLWRKFRKTIIVPPTTFLEAFPETLPGRTRLEEKQSQAQSD